MLYNWWRRWGEAGEFTRLMEGLAAAGAAPQKVMTDPIYLKAHRTASSLRAGKWDLGRLMDWRPVAIRYNRFPSAFFSAVTLAAAVIFWL